MIIYSLLIGKKNSTGFPGKNIMPINGLASCEYGFIAGSRINPDKKFVSTDSEEIKNYGTKYNYVHISRPDHLAKSESLVEDVLIHAYGEILKNYDRPDLIVLFFANTPAISVKLIKEGIDFLSKNESYDSAFSVCKYNMFSPLRAKKIENSQILPFTDLNSFDEPSSLRDSQGDVYFCDMSCQVVRSRVFENINKGRQPFQWMGQKTYPLINNFGFDIDADWQKATIEFWLKNYWDYK